MLEVYAGWMEEHVEKKNEGLARWCETGQTPKKDGMPSLEAVSGTFGGFTVVGSWTIG